MHPSLTCNLDNILGVRLYLGLLRKNPHAFVINSEHLPVICKIREKIILEVKDAVEF